MLYLVRYDEITLKWKNRKDFEKKLFDNIRYKCKTLNIEIKINKKFGKFEIETNDKNIEKILKTTAWIHSFTQVYTTELDIEKIKNKVLELFEQNLTELYWQKSADPTFFDKKTWILTYKIQSSRTNKNFELISPEITKIIWTTILKHFDKDWTWSHFFDSKWNKIQLKVDVKNPDFVLWINIAEKKAYIYFWRQTWIWGLPVWSSGKVVCLLSWWIDSPVASLLMMQRWCELILFHAYNHWTNLEKVKNKVIQLSQILANYQWSIKLYMISYKEIQKEIIQKIDWPYRMIAFKRSITRIANLIAQKHKAKAIINWDSVWQVASQTLENIECIHATSKLPILSPLIWMDKNNITKLAIKFWTYKISILPYEDCCSLIATNNPKTKWKLEEIENYEKNTNLENIEKQSFEESKYEILKIKNLSD